jgi:hypothetical protein
MKRIIYYADNASMGDAAPEDRDLFRSFAERRITEKFPEWDVEVINEKHLDNVLIDVDNPDEIEDMIEVEDYIRHFVGGLWDEANRENIFDVE